MILIYEIDQNAEVHSSTKLEMTCDVMIQNHIFITYIRRSSDLRLIYRKQKLSHQLMLLESMFLEILITIKMYHESLLISVELFKKIFWIFQN